MDKLTHAKFNLNNFFIAFSKAIDNTIEPNRYGVKYSSKRVAYTALKIANLLEFEASYCSDIFSYAIIYKTYTKLSGINIDKIPFINNDVINNDKIIDIIELALFIEDNIEITNNIIINKQDIIKQLDRYKKFHILFDDITFWLDLTQSCHLSFYIFNNLQDFTVELSYIKLIELSKVINTIVNQYNNINYQDISKICQNLAKLYSLDEKDSSRMIMGIYLYSVGKLFISQDILAKKDSLTSQEYEIIKSIPYFTNLTIQQVYGFDDIAKLCSTYCERLDGSGYPYRLEANALTLKDRILAILVVYQALVEDRNYRKAYNHKDAMLILKEEAKLNKLDITIVEDFEKLFNAI